ncbi:hypothetical protein YC2023_107080 [Brassica napus]
MPPSSWLLSSSSVRKRRGKTEKRERSVAPSGAFVLCRVDKKSELNTNSKRNVNEQTLGSGEISGYSSLVTSPNCDSRFLEMVPK